MYIGLHNDDKPIDSFLFFVVFIVLYCTVFRITVLHTILPIQHTLIYPSLTLFKLASSFFFCTNYRNLPLPGSTKYSTIYGNMIPNPGEGRSREGRV